MDCNTEGHLWAYQGLVYSQGNRVPGSGAHYRKYADRYYCQRCLDIRDANEREQSNDYYPPIPGAVPK